MKMRFKIPQKVKIPLMLIALTWCQKCDACKISVWPDVYKVKNFFQISITEKICWLSRSPLKKFHDTKCKKKSVCVYVYEFIQMQVFHIQLNF